MVATKSRLELASVDNPVLRQVAKAVEFPLNPEIRQLIADLSGFFAELESGTSKPVGLAAPQVGISKRMIMVQLDAEVKHIRKFVYDEFPATILINPIYTPVSMKKHKDWEGCYSVPELIGEVYRYNAIQYEAYNIDGEKISGVARGFFARLLQHEIGHLNGELWTDVVNEDCRVGPYEEMLALRRKEREAEMESGTWLQELEL